MKLKNEFNENLQKLIIRKIILEIYYIYNTNLKENDWCGIMKRQ